MSQSCETLITKINEWQKAILELEKLTDEFLNTGDEKLKSEIDAIRQEIKKHAEEYQKLAYPKLLNDQKLFWPEKEFAEIILNPLRHSGGKLDWNEVFKFQILFGNVNEKIEIKNNHVEAIGGVFYEDEPRMNLSLFKSLKYFRIAHDFNSRLAILPKLPKSVEDISIHVQKSIDVEAELEISGLEELLTLERLERIEIRNYRLPIIPKFPQSIKKIEFSGCKIDSEHNNLVYLDNLRSIELNDCGLKELPDFPKLIEKLDISENEDIEIPSSFAKFRYLKEIFLRYCNIERLPRLPGSIEIIDLEGNNFSESEIEEIKEKYSNVLVMY